MPTSAPRAQTPSFERLVARQKAKRAQILARRDTIRKRLAGNATPTPAAASTSTIGADTLAALMQLLIPFNAETNRLQQRRLTDAGSATAVA